MAEPSPRRPGGKDSAKDLRDEQFSELFVERYQFLVERLHYDIRYYLHYMQDFVDLPVDCPHPTWESCCRELESDLAALVAPISKENAPLGLDLIVTLLNYRSKVITLLVSGLLYKKAILDRDLKSQRDIEAGPMADMVEHIRSLAAKTDPLPEKFCVPDLPETSTPGPFTFEKSVEDARGSTAAEVTSVQRALVATFREMQSMDRGLRRMKFGPQANVPDKHRATGKMIRSEEVRKEITKWFDRCSRLEHELQTSKAQRHTPWEQQLEQLTIKCGDKDAQNKQHITRVHKLEGDVAALKAELVNVRREQQELTEKNQKMVRENLPVLDKIDRSLAKAREDADRLTADAEMLSSMFKLQVEEYKRAATERDDAVKEVGKAQRQLKSERVKNEFKAEELQKKEQLHLRTIQAREETLETYNKQKAEIEEVQKRLQSREEDRKQILGVLADRDGEILRLKQALREANGKIDDLEQQKRHMAQEFKVATGRTYCMLLDQCKTKQKDAQAPSRTSPRSS